MSHRAQRRGGRCDAEPRQQIRESRRPSPQRVREVVLGGAGRPRRRACRSRAGGARSVFQPCWRAGGPPSRPSEDTASAARRSEPSSSEARSVRSAPRSASTTIGGCSATASSCGTSPASAVASPSSPGPPAPDPRVPRAVVQVRLDDDRAREPVTALDGPGAPRCAAAAEVRRDAEPDRRTRRRRQGLLCRGDRSRRSAHRVSRGACARRCTTRRPGRGNARRTARARAPGTCSSRSRPAPGRSRRCEVRQRPLVAARRAATRRSRGTARCRSTRPRATEYAASFSSYDRSSRSAIANHGAGSTCRCRLASGGGAEQLPLARAPSSPTGSSSAAT